MARLTLDELRKFAHMSQLQVPAAEEVHLMEALDARLTYTAMVNNILATHTEQARASRPSEQKLNVMRQDIPVASDAKPLLAIAPRREENFFVVPVIVKQK
jgi:aspartyl/glutamyl-tRNA(Asn/Gln) amidotransferase C subunit